jgi:hypothetical protein
MVDPRHVASSAPFLVDCVEDAVPACPPTSQIWRPIRKRLRRARLVSELPDVLPECGDASGVVAEEARRLVHGQDLPVDLIAHREDRPRRRPASSWEM